MGTRASMRRAACPVATDDVFLNSASSTRKRGKIKKLRPLNEKFFLQFFSRQPTVNCSSL